jgi:hypothetical protein
MAPDFESKDDYDILGRLSVCPPAGSSEDIGPGPTDCVIDKNFSEAIQSQKTVAEAITDGTLNGDARMMRNVDYTSGYSLRSAMILRKYRILPVGWEEAIIQAEAHGAKVTLRDMVSCFDENDDYDKFSNGFGQTDWCVGLVDPTWVLLAPQNRCEKMGSGGYVVSKVVTPPIPTFDNNSAPTGSESEVIMTRSEEYCGQEKSCVVENPKGGCVNFGYCTEEKRVWKFGAESDLCEPVFNTCNAYIDSTGRAAAYLENTINHEECSAENAGCRQYSLAATVYNASTNYINWSPTAPIYFNKNIATCASSDEGCSAYLRTRNSSHNFIVGGDFEGSAVAPNGAEVISGGAENSTQALIATTTITWGVAVAPVGQSIADESYILSFYARNCALNTQIVLNDETFKIADKVREINSGYDSTGSAFVPVYFTTVLPLNFSSNIITFQLSGLGANESCTIDKLKLENNLGIVTNKDSITGYNDYGVGASVINEKVIPPYLEAVCYENASVTPRNYDLKKTAPAICSKFAKKCNAIEAGCDLFKTAGDNTGIAAKTKVADYCPTECVGYDTYIQKETYFNNKEAKELIPFANATNGNRVKACSAVASGCNEFTNLDELAKGGEAREYYTYLRQCIKPENPVAKCQDFYSWENSGGQAQLKVYSLNTTSTPANSAEFPELVSGFKASTTGLLSEEVVNATNGAAVCNEEIFNSTDPTVRNSDCRQFYNKAGHISYRLLQHTISCNANCHPYRVSDEIPAEKCKAIGGVIDTTIATTTCVTYAVPGEGKTCNAAENGCREYNGNQGNNVKIITSFDFENTFNYLCRNGNSGTIAAEAINKDGHSLRIGSDTCPAGQQWLAVNGIWLKNLGGLISNVFARLTNNALAQNLVPGKGVALPVGIAVRQNAAYTLKFLAKAKTDTNISFSLTDFNNASLFNADNNSGGVSISGNNTWQVYTISLPNLDHKPTDRESLVVEVNGGEVYLDNITLTEITNRYYLIKDSWTTPNACYYDIKNEYQGANYNLGCKAYADRLGGSHNLRQFNKLCADNSVGCELLVDTKNSTTDGARYFIDGAEVTKAVADETCSKYPEKCLTIPADNYFYAKYDKTKECKEENKGCSRLGASLALNPNVADQGIFNDAYVKNNPDKYVGAEGILCGADGAGCEEFKDVGNSNAPTYFKNPIGSICEWRAPNDKTKGTTKKWYRQKVSRCDMDAVGTPNYGKINADIYGNITEVPQRLCLKDTDCVYGAKTGKCISDTNDYLCPVDASKTIGLGGDTPLYQPKGAVGACDSVAFSCTEYIDPTSNFMPNLIADPNNVLGPNQLWKIIKFPGDNFSSYVQQVPLTKNKLYRFGIDDTNIAEGADAAVILTCAKKIKILNNANALVETSTPLTIGNGVTAGILFFSGDNNTCSVRGLEDGDRSKTINVREAVVDYQLASGLDKQSCNSSGGPNLDSGCIMFNERKSRGLSLSGDNILTELNSNAASSYLSPNHTADNSCTTAGYTGNACDTNQLIKVSPSRVCNKWLACSNLTVDKVTGKSVCNQVKECNKVDADTDLCTSFIDDNQTNSHDFNANLDKNVSGLAKIGGYYFTNMTEVGENVEGGHWDFEDVTVPPTDLAGQAETGVIPSTAPSGVYLNLCDTEDADGKCTQISPFKAVNSGPTTVITNQSAFTNSQISYPAHGKVLLKVNKLGAISNSIDVEKGKDYYINYLVNISGSNGAAAVVSIEGGTLCSADGKVSTTSAIFKTARGSGWQRIVNKFIPSGSSIKVRLKTDNPSFSAYFDDINIEPVLKTGPNSYAAKDCRLYPATDSLTCKSDNPSVTGDGWLGYCLYYDVKNPSVCLMWYPVDRVSSNEVQETANTAFNGVANVINPKPYYCTMINLNIDLVEERKAKQVFGSRRNGLDCEIQPLSPIPFNYFCFYTNNGVFQGGYGNNYQYIDIITDNPSDESYLNQYAVPQNNGGTAFSITPPSCSPDDIIMTLPLPNPTLSGTTSGGQRRIFSSPDSSIASSITYQGGDGKNYCNYNFKSNGDGYYIYDGATAGPDGSPKLIDYATTNKDECEKTLNTCDADTGDCINNIFVNANGVTGCIMDLEEYKPICAESIRVDIPWVDRLKNYPVKSNPPILNSYEPLGAYKFWYNRIENSKMNNYYGASDTDPAGQVLDNGVIPLACHGVYCSYLTWRDWNGPNSGLGIGSTVNTEFQTIMPIRLDPPAVDESSKFIQRNLLKNLFLKGSSATDGFNYDYSMNPGRKFDCIDADTEEYLSSKLGCLNGPEDGAINFKFTPPLIGKNSLTCDGGTKACPVKLFGPGGGEITQVAGEEGVFPIAVSGWYTLTFNTWVAIEQAPISKLIVNFGDNSPITPLRHIDSKNQIANPFYYQKYFSIADGKNREIKIKVVDNWGFYGCYGNTGDCRTFTGETGASGTTVLGVCSQ